VRLGILGGSFDPPHLGHLILAEQCRHALALDRVLFVPAYRPPHKIDREQSSFEVRAAMVAAAIAEVAPFELCDIERQRGGLSFTVDTLRDLQARYPQAELWLLLGQDSLEDLEQWRAPEQLLQLAQIAAYRREGSRGTIPPLLGGRVRFVEGPRVDVSSSELRERVHAGESIRFLVPAPVAELIIRERLYVA
jgi:nicotinate-nucleotide adenylyltransferase